MKVRAILEFDLEDEDGDPVRDRREYVWAAEATDDAIRARLMGHGFLADDTLIGTYAVNVSIVDDATDNRDPDDLMTNHGGVWADQHHLLRALDELRGRDLVCFCAPLPCHGHLLRRLANASRDERIAWWRAVKAAA